MANGIILKNYDDEVAKIPVSGLVDTTDANTVTKSGFYGFGGGSDSLALHYPIQSSGSLIVFNASRYIVQEFYPNGNETDLYTRSSIDGGTTWGSWRRYYCDSKTVSTKTYFSSGNSNINVYRLGTHLRVFNVWNTSLDSAKTITLDSEDRPSVICDSPLFVTDDGKMGRFRINTTGSIVGWVFTSYGGAASDSSSSLTFIQFLYYV